MKFERKFVSQPEFTESVTSIILALPLFICVRSVFDAILAIAVFIVMAILCIGAELLFQKFSDGIESMPICIMLCGAVALVFCGIGKDLSSNIVQVSTCSVVTAMSFSHYASSQKRIIRPIRAYGIGFCVLTLTGAIRELLISGTVFKGFTDNGISIMTFEFGEYISTSSSFFLIVTIIVFIIECFTWKRTYCIEGISVVFLSASVLSVLISLSVFGLNRVGFDSISSAVPYILSAVIFLIFSRLVNRTAALIISMEALIISVFITEYAENLLSLLIASAVITVILYFAILLIETAVQRKKNHVLSYISFIMLISAYLIEVIL